MGLFEPAWMSNNVEKRMKAINKVTDQQQLLDIIARSTFEDVTDAAFRQLNDTAVKVDLLMNHSKIIRAFSEQMPIDLARELTDENTLYELTVKYQFAECARIASEKINDQLLLVKLVLNLEKGWSLFSDKRETAVNKLVQCDDLSPETVRYVLVHLDDPVYRDKILQKIDLSAVKQEVWQEVADNEHLDTGYRCEAIEHITDRNYLLRIAMNTDYYHVRGLQALATYALRQLHTQQDILAVIMSDDVDHRILEEAVGRLQDPEPMVQHILDKTTPLGTCLNLASALVPTKRIPEDRIQEVVDAIVEKIESDEPNSIDKRTSCQILACNVLSLESGQEKYGVLMNKIELTDGDGIDYSVCDVTFKK